MKNIFKFICVLAISGLSLGACSDLLDVDSERTSSVDDNKLDSANDSVYSMMGILRQLRDISDRVVVFGELRGDLMGVTSNTDVDLQAINNFTATEDNSWLSPRDYYKVINSCNYLINNMDTSIVKGGEKVLVPEFVQAKTIRAWVYLQLLTTYGKAAYLEEPILSVEDALAEYPVYEMDAFLDLLIKDLEPWTEERLPYYTSVGGYESDYLFLPTKFVLGDLYLWAKQYENAAKIYYRLIYERRLTVSAAYRSYWSNVNLTAWNRSWNNIFSEFTGEVITLFGFDEDSGQTPLFDLTYTDYQLVPSKYYIETNSTQDYSDVISVDGNNVIVTTTGDMRGEDGSYEYTYFINNTILTEPVPVIKKYKDYQEGYTVYAYRTSLLYLRYAEALNQLGKPSLALTVLNFGLTSATVGSTSTSVNLAEITPIEDWFDFSSDMFAGNRGTRQRGLGISESNALGFPVVNSLQDSIAFVEECLREELALETAFEGNRFPDLMRMARHRNDNSFLALPVAMKHGTDYSRIYNLLLDEKNWYLPYPEK